MTTETITALPSTEQEWRDSFREGVPRSASWSAVTPYVGAAIAHLREAFTSAEAAAAASDTALINAFANAIDEAGGSYSTGADADNEQVVAWLRSWIAVWGDAAFTGTVKAGADSSLAPTTDHVWAVGDRARIVAHPRGGRIGQVVTITQVGLPVGTDYPMGLATRLGGGKGSSVTQMTALEYLPIVPPEPAEGWEAWIEKMAPLWRELSGAEHLEGTVAALAKEWHDDPTTQPKDAAEALAQARRKVRVLSKDAVRYSSDKSAAILSRFLFKAVLRKVRGEVVVSPPTAREVREALEAEGYDTYTVRYVAECIPLLFGSDGGPDIETDPAAVRAALDRMARERYGAIPPEMLETMTDMAIPALDYSPGVGIEPVTDTESLIKALLARIKEPSPFQVRAITNGVTDFMDAWRNKEPFIGSREDSLRRAVRAYGEAKFTGGSRRVLSTMLEAVTSGTPEPLTAEEWAARFKRFGLRVASVAGRYGTEHNMCSTLEAACADLDLTMTRTPEDRVVRLRHPESGLTIQVPANTWASNDGAIATAARQSWNSMTVAEREAAIIERGSIVPQWSNMLPV